VITEPKTAERSFVTVAGLSERLGKYFPADTIFSFLRLSMFRIA